MSELFHMALRGTPYKVALPGVILPHHHYQVRAMLAQLCWLEFEDWIICPATHTLDEAYEVWFASPSKATLFKLMFSLDDPSGS